MSGGKLNENDGKIKKENKAILNKAILKKGSPSTANPGLSKGYVQVYFGTGKGKTTAAIGLAIRAAGCGLKVYIAQFIKGLVYSEIKALQKFKDSITVKQYGRGCFIKNEPAEKDIEAAKQGLEHASQVILSGKYDVVILDEITIAQYFGLITTEEIIELIKSKPSHVELVLTGRKVDRA